MSAGAFTPHRRAALWIPGTGPESDPDRAHLFIVLTDTCPQEQNLLVPICKAERKYDSTCLLGSGDHKFLTRLSYAAYYLLQLYNATFLTSQIQKNVIKFRGDLDEKVFALICAGVTQSRESAPRYKTYFIQQTSPAKKA